MKADDEQCATCKFWLLPPHLENPEYIYGVCRRYPPTIQYSPAERTLATTREKGNALWPRVRESTWCGEWKAAIGERDLDKLKEWASEGS